MEMLTKLQTEEHSIKDLTTKLNQQEDELKDVREAVRRINCKVSSYMDTDSMLKLSFIIIAPLWICPVCYSVIPS